MLRKGQKYELISGIQISSTRKLKVLSSVRSFLLDWRGNYEPGKAKLAVTPNPEIVNRALGDKNLAKILNSADYSLIDGVGLAQSIKFLSLPRPKNPLIRVPVLIFQGLRVGFATVFNKEWLLEDIEIVKGREFFVDLIKLANKKGWKVFLLGGGGASQDLKDVLARSFKKVRIKAEEGPKLKESGNPLTKKDIKKEKEIVEKINKYSPELLFVGFGAPKQEKWLNKWLPQLKVGVAMTVGGTFDYLAGRVDMPPRWMEEMGLEWLWRLVTQPNLKRIKRVLTAFPLFPLKIFWYKLTK